ncbi:hypothetical protein MRX96_008026 [Rhipicephalus microplus]
MSKADAAVVEADNQTVGASGESVSNDESQLEKRGSRFISKPCVQPQAPTAEKVGPSGHSAGWHETQVMTVLVFNLTTRDSLSAEDMDKDNGRLFS